MEFEYDRRSFTAHGITEYERELMFIYLLET